MTPTEQDKVSDEELKSYIIEQLHSFDREEEMFDTYVDRFLQLITADRKRVALEARIDELENNKWLPNEAKWIEQEADRIAELKAQQEEV